jgi:nucleoside phosphorylase
MNERVDAILVPRGAESAAVRRGTLSGIPVFSCAAGEAAGRALDRFEPGALVAMMGLCGALDPSLAVGSAVVYERLAAPVTYTFDASSERLAALLRSRLVAGAAVPRVLGSVAAKAELFAASGAAACDMESAAFVRALEERGVRGVVIRVVSDDARHELPDLTDAYDADGALRPLALASAFVREPARSLRFVRGALAGLGELERIAARLVT